jgi:hypothetical protein
VADKDLALQALDDAFHTAVVDAFRVMTSNMVGTTGFVAAEKFRNALQIAVAAYAEAKTVTEEVFKT